MVTFVRRRDLSCALPENLSGLAIESEHVEADVRPVVQRRRLGPLRHLAPVAGSLRALAPRPALPVGIAVVTKIRSPQIAGVEKPRPGISVFHLMLLVSLQTVGASPRAMPLKNGPRHCGQCAELCA